MQRNIIIKQKINNRIIGQYKCPNCRMIMSTSLSEMRQHKKECLGRKAEEWAIKTIEENKEELKKLSEKEFLNFVIYG